MTEKKEVPILRFEEVMKGFRKRISYFEELAVDVYFGEEHIGCIWANGKITVSGYVTEKDPCTIMSYSNTFTFRRWMEIGAKAEEFVKKCAERDAKFDPLFRKLEDQARKAFSQDAPFGHIEIAKVRHDHIVIAGGKGDHDIYEPGIYTYDDTPYQGKPVKIGYRPVNEEQRVKGVNNLSDEMLLELVKVVGCADGCKETERQQEEAVVSANRGEM